MKMMEVFILKFQTIAQYQIPEILSRWYGVCLCMYYVWYGVCLCVCVCACVCVCVCVYVSTYAWMCVVCMCMYIDYKRYF